MAIKAVGLTTLTVSNLKEAKEFFVDKLGLKLCSDASEHGWLEISVDDCCPEPVLGIGEENPQHGPFKAGSNGLVSFIVDDVIAEKERLEKKGINFLDPIQKFRAMSNLRYLEIKVAINFSGRRFRRKKIGFLGGLFF